MVEDVPPEPEPAPGVPVRVVSWEPEAVEIVDAVPVEDDTDPVVRQIMERIDALEDGWQGIHNPGGYL